MGGKGINYSKQIHFLRLNQQGQEKKKCCKKGNEKLKGNFLVKRNRMNS